MLPKTKYPIVDITIPSTKEIKKFRPIIVKEEKLLLMAKSSESESDIFNVIKQIVNNCSIDESFDVDSLALYELEYIFLKLRGYSIGNKIEVVYKDLEDEQKYTVEINLDNIEIVYPNTDPESNIITIDEDTEIALRYPPASLYSDHQFLDAENENVFEELITRCVEYIKHDGKKIVVDANNDEQKKELIEFIDNLESSKYSKFQEFFASTPHMEYTVKYTNSLGNEKSIVLRTLNDFFMLR